MSLENWCQCGHHRKLHDEAMSCIVCGFGTCPQFICESRSPDGDGLPMIKGLGDERAQAPARGEDSQQALPPQQAGVHARQGLARNDESLLKPADGSNPSDSHTNFPAALPGRAQASPEKWERQLAHIAAFKGSWYEPGTPAIDPRCIDAVRRFLSALSVVPCVSGGIQLEWHGGDVDLELEFDNDGKPTSVYAHRASDDHDLAADDPEVASADAAVQEPNQWRPIETAPKDDTPILTRRGGDLLAVAAYFPHGEAEWCCTDGVHLLNVTHWMPLPAAPLPATEPQK